MSIKLSSGNRVLVTGGTGFVGTNLCIYLQSIGCDVIIASRGIRKSYLSSNFEIIHGNLSNTEDCKKAVKDVDYIFHLAASGFTSITDTKLAARTFNDNILMNGNILKAALNSGVKKFLFASSGSIYPPHLSLLEEEKAWDGNPHSAEWYFAWTKRLGELQCKSLYDEFKFPIAICRIGAVYGPFDNFDPSTARVVPALIGRTVKGKDPLIVWGSGKAIRSFVYIDDVIRGLCETLDNYAVSDALNIAVSSSSSIKNVVTTIIKICKYKGKIVFDASKPGGNPYKVMSHKKALEKISFLAKVSLEEGMQKTIKWYNENRNKLVSY